MDKPHVLMTNEERLIAGWLIHCIEERREAEAGKKKAHRRPRFYSGAVWRFNHEHTGIACLYHGCEWKLTLDPLPLVLPFTLVPSEDPPA